jgi:hypothetical protein
MAIGAEVESPQGYRQTPVSGAIIWLLWGAYGSNSSSNIYIDRYIYS